MNLAEAREIKIVSGQVELEGAGRRIVGSASGDGGVIVNEMNVSECDFAMNQLEGGIELLNGLTVDGAVDEMDLSLAMGIEWRTRGAQRKIGLAGDGVVVPGEGLERREVIVVKRGAEGEWTVAREMAVLERGGRVEFGRSVAAAESGAAKSDSAEGKLNRGGKRIPVGLKSARSGGGGQVDVEIVDLQSAGKLRRGECTTHAAIESGAAVQSERKHRRTTNESDDG